jgi:hypothetical protein
MGKFKLLLVAAATMTFMFAVPSNAMGIAGNCDEAEIRVVQFLKNAHTGKAMSAEKWMTNEARRAPMFAGFGGLNALVTQSTERAKKYGGLDSIIILSKKRIDVSCEVSAEVKFLKDHRDLTNPSVAGNEDMVWTFQMRRQMGLWKIAR